jgi:hypothetical protein
LDINARTRTLKASDEKIPTICELWVTGKSGKSGNFWPRLLPGKHNGVCKRLDNRKQREASMDEFIGREVPSKQIESSSVATLSTVMTHHSGDIDGEPQDDDTPFNPFDRPAASTERHTAITIKSCREQFPSSVAGIRDDSYFRSSSHYYSKYYSDRNFFPIHDGGHFACHCFATPIIKWWKKKYV